MFKITLFAALLSASWFAYGHINDSKANRDCDDLLGASFFVPDEAKLNPAKSYYKASSGRFLRFRKYSRDVTAIRRSDFLHVSIHGLGDSAESFQDYNQGWARAGYNSIAVGLHGSDLDLLRMEFEARQRLSKVYEFDHQVQDIVDLLVAQGEKQVAITSHSAGVPIALAVARDLKRLGFDVAVLVGAPYLNFKTAIERGINPKEFAKMAKDAVMNPTRVKERLEGMLKFFLVTALRDHVEKTAQKHGVVLDKKDLNLLAEGGLGIAQGVKPVDLMDRKDPMEIRSTLRESSLMVIYGEEDKVVDSKSARAFVDEMLKDSHRVRGQVLPGIGHDLFENSATMTFPMAHDFFVEAFTNTAVIRKPVRALMRFFQRGAMPLAGE